MRPTLDIHTTSPLVIVVVWAGIVFGLGVGIGAVLGWIVRSTRKEFN